mmetsp:Transcript_52368/g.132357  ORF Transcript_52368/g.132357 Transcript_52368/m.132357 type:complete len:209 (+) Transcript_52368:161-787(+)
MRQLDSPQRVRDDCIEALVILARWLRTCGFPVEALTSRHVQHPTSLSAFQARSTDDEGPLGFQLALCVLADLGRPERDRNHPATSRLALRQAEGDLPSQLFHRRSVPRPVHLQVLQRQEAHREAEPPALLAYDLHGVDQGGFRQELVPHGLLADWAQHLGVHVTHQAEVVRRSVGFVTRRIPGWVGANIARLHPELVLRPILNKLNKR